MNWANNAATDGSITATSIFVPTTAGFDQQLQRRCAEVELAGSQCRAGISRSQTNTLANGLGTNWVSSTGTTSVTTTNFPADSGNAAVFYRLAAPGF